MRAGRAVIAMDPLQFGRGRSRVLKRLLDTRVAVPKDLRLFATTFAAGFIFISILLG